MDVRHEDLLRMPFEVGATGPRAYDCLGVVREYLRRLRLPDPVEHRSAWVRLGGDHALASRAGDVVLLDAGDRGVPGVLVRVSGSRPTFITSIEGRGVRCLTRLAGLPVEGVYRAVEVAP